VKFGYDLFKTIAVEKNRFEMHRNIFRTHFFTCNKNLTGFDIGYLDRNSLIELIFEVN
jgi:hypothetical protein